MTSELRAAEELTMTRRVPVASIAAVCDLSNTVVNGKESQQPRLQRRHVFRGSMRQSMCEGKDDGAGKRRGAWGAPESRGLGLMESFQGQAAPKPLWLTAAARGKMLVQEHERQKPLDLEAQSKVTRRSWRWRPELFMFFILTEYPISPAAYAMR